MVKFKEVCSTRAILRAGRMAAISIGKSQHFLYASAKGRIENKKKKKERRGDTGGSSKLIATCIFCVDQVQAAQHDPCSHGHARSEADKTPLCVWLPG